MITEITTTINKTYSGIMHTSESVRTLNRDAMAWEIYVNLNSAEIVVSPKHCYNAADEFIAEMERQRGEVKE